MNDLKLALHNLLNIRNHFINVIEHTDKKTLNEFLTHLQVNNIVCPEIEQKIKHQLTK